MIFFISCHKIMNTLENIKTIFKQDRKIFIAKELTKINEELIYASLYNIPEFNLKGEFTVVLQGKTQNNNQDLDGKKIEKILSEINISTKDLSKILSIIYEKKYSEIYEEIINIKNYL